ncbi:MAG TPA: hypothetical protein VG844_11120 [Terracidiphilus sp.]|nr:hypothetical protein [Terracidiphilus sp.]
MRMFRQLFCAALSARLPSPHPPHAMPALRGLVTTARLQPGH